MFRLSLRAHQQAGRPNQCRVHDESPLPGFTVFFPGLAGSLEVALRSHEGGFTVALRWLSGAYRLATNRL